jgi:hypothetical protein
MPKPVAAQVLIERPCMSISTDYYSAPSYIDLMLSTLASHVSAGRQYRKVGGPLLSPKAWALPGSYGILSLSSASWRWICSELRLGMAGSVIAAGCPGYCYNTHCGTFSFPSLHTTLPSPSTYHLILLTRPL